MKQLSSDCSYFQCCYKTPTASEFPETCLTLPSPVKSTRKKETFAKNKGQCRK